MICEECGQDKALTYRSARVGRHSVCAMCIRENHPESLAHPYALHTDRTLEENGWFGRNLIEEIPIQPQRQDSLSEQFIDVYRSAIRLGCRDAADWLLEHGPVSATAIITAKPDRYTVHRIDNRPWGGFQWGIWDNLLETWADSLGRFLDERAAIRAAGIANVTERAASLSAT